MTDTETEHQNDASRSIPPQMSASWVTATQDPDPLAALGASRALVGQLIAWDAQLVGEAIAGGATWEAIGSTVGVSRQAAWERFHGDVHEFRDRVKTGMQELRDRHHQELIDLRESIKNEVRTRRQKEK